MRRKTPADTDPRPGAHFVKVVSDTVSYVQVTGTGDVRELSFKELGHGPKHRMHSPG